MSSSTVVRNCENQLGAKALKSIQHRCKTLNEIKYRCSRWAVIPQKGLGILMGSKEVDARDRRNQKEGISHLGCDLCYSTVCEAPRVTLLSAIQLSVREAWQQCLSLLHQ